MEPKQETMDGLIQEAAINIADMTCYGGQLHPNEIKPYLTKLVTHAIEAHDREIAEKVKKVSWETNDLPGGKLVTLDEVLSLINKQI